MDSPGARASAARAEARSNYWGAFFGGEYSVMDPDGVAGHRDGEKFGLASDVAGVAAPFLKGFSLLRGVAAAEAGAESFVLNLGAGTNPMAGAVNLDLRALNGINVVADATKLPFRSATFSEVNSINPFGFNPVNAETARVMQPGGLLHVTGTANNRFAQPMNALDARAAGFEVVSSRPMIDAHAFGTQRATTGGALRIESSITTTYRRTP